MSAAVRSLRFDWRDDTAAGLIDAAKLRPDIVCTLEDRELYSLRIGHGVEDIELGDLFRAVTVSGIRPPWIALPGSRRLIRVGAGMQDGTLEVDGDVGTLAGADMRGGELHIGGNAGALAGAGMRGGQLVIDGDCGDGAAGPLPGSSRGMSGGELIVLGDAGDDCGLRMRRGLLATRGRIGRGCGAGMIAGTIVVAGGDLDGCGAGMNRGTIIGLDARPCTPPGFREDGPTRPIFWRVLCRRLLELDVIRDESSIDAGFRSFGGDIAALGRGELLYREAPNVSR